MSEEKQQFTITNIGDIVALIKKLAEEQGLTYLEALETQRLWDDLCAEKAQQELHQKRMEAQIAHERAKKFGVMPIKRNGR